MARRGNGEGCITHEKSRNRWRGIISEGIDPNTGKIIKRNIYGKTRQEVAEKLNVLLYEKANCTYIKKNTITLIDIINSIIEKKYKANIIADRQYKTLKQHSNQIAKSKIAKMNAQKITTADLQNYLNTLTHYSQSYIKKLCTLLNNAFNDLTNKNIINVNPMKLVLIPKSDKDKKEVRALTISEQKIFTKYLINSSVYEEPYKNVFLIQMYLGLRVGEALALKKSDFTENNTKVIISRTISEDKEGNRIMKNKTKTFAGKRELYIPEYLQPYINEQLEIANKNKDGLLFCYKGNYIRHNSINSVLKRIFKSDLNLNPNGIASHILRKTYATRCNESEIDLAVASRTMGHTEISMTLENYVAVQDEFVIEELKKLNNFIEKNIEFEPQKK